MTARALFEPERHEPAAEAPWDAARARGAIDAIARDAWEVLEAEGWWPAHALDRESDPTERYTNLYFGAAGVLWALDWLAAEGATGAPRPGADRIAGLAEENLAQIAERNMGTPSFFFGQSGVLLTAYGLGRDPALLDALAAQIAANHDNVARELCWGSPGTLLAAWFLHEETGDERWAALFRDGARALWSRWTACPSGPELIEQDFAGGVVQFWGLGAAHGFAGCLAPLLRGRALLDDDLSEALVPRVGRALAASATFRDGRANWHKYYDVVGPDVDAGAMRMHWCHGAPGIVSCLALEGDAALDALMLQAGEAVWAAGPLVKHGGLCHGTAGNGYAFLRLYALTGDDVWLGRARAFAMRALAKSEAFREREGAWRWSLYTGDLGVACFLWDCVEGRCRFPALDAFF